MDSTSASVMAIFQLAETLKDLHDFFRSVRDAPKNIHALVAELQALLVVLNHASAEVHYSSLESTIMDLVKSCNDKATTILQHIQPLYHTLSNGNLVLRKWTAIKAVFQTERLEELTVSLERLKTTLVLAQSFHQRYMYCQGRILFWLGNSFSPSRNFPLNLFSVLFADTLSSS